MQIDIHLLRKLEILIAKDSWEFKYEQMHFLSLVILFISCSLII